MYSSVRTFMSWSASCSIRIGVSPMTMRYGTPASRRSWSRTRSGRYVPRTASCTHSSPCGHRPAPRAYGRCEWSASTKVPTRPILFHEAGSRFCVEIVSGSRGPRRNAARSWPFRCCGRQAVSDLVPKRKRRHMPAAVTDLATALLTGLAAGLATLISAIPSILGALIILLLGWIITGALAGAVAKALRAVRVNAAADRAGVTGVLQRAKIRSDAAGVIAGVVKWYLRLIVILMAADAVKLTAVSTIVNQVLAFIPNLIVAVVILAVFSWLASLARNLVTAALQPTMPNAKTIGVLAYGATFGFGVIAAATQIGVATTLLDILFVGIVGALALAFGLAFGLGGREEAARMWREMNGAVGNVVKEGAPAAANASGNGRPVERTEHAIRT